MELFGSVYEIHKKCFLRVKRLNFAPDFLSTRATGTESLLYPSHGSSGGGDIYIGFGTVPVGVGVRFSCVQGQNYLHGYTGL